MESPNISEHAYKRLKERMGINKKAADNTLKKVLQKGVPHSGIANKRVKRYLDGIFLKHRKARKLMIWSEHVFIFCGSTLATVYKIPTELRRGLK